MKRTSFFFAVVVMIFAIAGIATAQTARTFGAGRFELDDGTGSATGVVFMSDQLGSLGIDLGGNSGVINGFQFPSPCALLDLSSTTKGFLVPRMSGPPTA